MGGLIQDMMGFAWAATVSGQPKPPAIRFGGVTTRRNVPPGYGVSIPGSLAG